MSNTMKSLEFIVKIKRKCRVHIKRVKNIRNKKRNRLMIVILATE